MKRSFWILLAGTALVFPATFGCTEQVTDKDVQAARKDADKEHQDVAAARREAEKKITTESQEARDADRKLNETEMKAMATKDRDAYVALVEPRLVAADQRVEELKKTAADQTDAAKTATQDKVKDIQMRRDHLKQTLDDLKAADLLHWDTQRAAVQRAVDDLNRSMS